jgi:hypothetical protein
MTGVSAPRIPASSEAARSAPTRTYAVDRDTLGQARNNGRGLIRSQDR